MVTRVKSVGLDWSNIHTYHVFNWILIGRLTYINKKAFNTISFFSVFFFFFFAMTTKPASTQTNPSVEIIKTGAATVGNKRGRPSDDSLPIIHRAKVFVRKLWMDCKTDDDIILVQKIRKIVERDNSQSPPPPPPPVVTPPPPPPPPVVTPPPPPPPPVVTPPPPPPPPVVTPSPPRPHQKVNRIAPPTGIIKKEQSPPKVRHVDENLIKRLLEEYYGKQSSENVTIIQ